MYWENGNKGNDKVHFEKAGPFLFNRVLESFLFWENLLVRGVATEGVL